MARFAAFIFLCSTSGHHLLAVYVSLLLLGLLLLLGVYLEERDESASYKQLVTEVRPIALLPVPTVVIANSTMKFFVHGGNSELEFGSSTR